MSSEIEKRMGDGLLIPAAGLVAVVLFVQLPVTVYGGSPSDFDFGLVQLLPVWACLATGFFLALMAIAVRLSSDGRRRLATSLWVAGVWIWVSGNVTVFSVGRLSGTPLDFGRARRWVIPELLLGAAIVGVALWLVARRPLIARRIACVVLAVASLVSVGRLLIDLPRWGSFSSTWPSSLTRFAGEDDVLVVLLDSFQSDVFAELVAEDEDLVGSFDGFTYYPDTLGVARTTALTMPAVHTGLRYDPAWTLDEYLERAGERDSFLTRVAGAGHEVTLVGPFGGCPLGGSWCGELDELISEPWADFWSEVFLPVDLAVFRVAPVWLKSGVYGRGRWLTLRLLRLHPGKEQQERSHEFLERLTVEARVDVGPPTVKFLHLPAPHAPLVTGEGCELVSEDLEKTRENLVVQSRCVLRRVADLLATLSGLGILEGATVILMSDHGAGLPAGVVSDEAEEFLERMTAANPLLAVKSPGAVGAMRESRQAVQIDDVGRTVCRAVEGCRYRWGRFLTNPGPPGRPRQFLDYRWRTDDWYERGRIEVTTWEVRGPLDKQASWTRVDSGAEL